MLSEISQILKDKSCLIPAVGNLASLGQTNSNKSHGRYGLGEGCGVIV